MGQTIRTTKLPLDLGKRTQGGANTGKRAYLEATVQVLDAARAFYLAFFLAHPEKVTERVAYFSEQHQHMRERLISANALLTWAECQTVETKEHPHPLPDWNFSRAFPNFPFVYRRSVIKDVIGKRRGKRRAGQAGLERATTLRCMREHVPWNCLEPISSRASCP